MTTSENKEQALRLAFSNIVDDLKKWGQKVDSKIKEALQAATIFDYNAHVKMAPSFRVKEIDSFIKKALYRKNSGKIYNDPLIEIEDKVGTRIVVLTSQHMEQVRDILISRDDLWICTIGRDKALIKESIKEFDYVAIHLIVKPCITENQILEEKIPYLTCEIQIKTLFQHAYSEMSHDTVYKGPYRHDLTLLRKLARSMALLESTDETFNSMYSHINSGQGLAICFLQELIQQFKKVDPDFDEKNTDMDLDAYVLDELMGKDVLSKVEFDEITWFVGEEIKALKRINNKPNFLIGKHPVMVLLTYLLKYTSEENLANADIDIDMLQSLAFMMNANYEPNA